MLQIECEEQFKAAKGVKEMKNDHGSYCTCGGQEPHAHLSKEDIERMVEAYIDDGIKIGKVPREGFLADLDGRIRKGLREWGITRIETYDEFYARCAVSLPPEWQKLRDRFGFR